jgi:hypothetical protein
MNKFLNEWTSLVNKENKKDFIYKRELLIETNYNIYFDFPIARQVVARNVGFDLVSVQPLSTPIELSFYVDFYFEPENVYKRIILVEKIEKHRKSRRSRRSGNRTVDSGFIDKT